MIMYGSPDLHTERERETCIKRAHSHEHVDPFKKGSVFMVQYGNKYLNTNILSRSNWTSSLYTEVTVCHYLLKWQRMNLNGKSFATHRNCLYISPERLIQAPFLNNALQNRIQQFFLLSFR